jgi:hypothetical protein
MWPGHGTPEGIRGLATHGTPTGRIVLEVIRSSAEQEGMRTRSSDACFSPSSSLLLRYDGGRRGHDRRDAQDL